MLESSMISDDTRDVVNRIARLFSAGRPSAMDRLPPGGVRVVLRRLAPVVLGIVADDTHVTNPYALGWRERCAEHVGRSPILTLHHDDMLAGRKDAVVNIPLDQGGSIPGKA